MTYHQQASLPSLRDWGRWHTGVLYSSILLANYHRQFYTLCPADYHRQFYTLCPADYHSQFYTLCPADYHRQFYTLCPADVLSLPFWCLHSPTPRSHFLLIWYCLFLPAFTLTTKPWAFLLSWKEGPGTNNKKTPHHVTTLNLSLFIMREFSHPEFKYWGYCWQLL